MLLLLHFNNQRNDQRPSLKFFVNEAVDVFADVAFEVFAVGAGVFGEDFVVGEVGGLDDLVNDFGGFFHVDEAAGNDFGFADEFACAFVGVEHNDERAVLR